MSSRKLSGHFNSEGLKSKMEKVAHAIRCKQILGFLSQMWARLTFRPMNTLREQLWVQHISRGNFGMQPGAARDLFVSEIQTSKPNCLINGSVVPAVCMPTWFIVGRSDSSQWDGFSSAPPFQHILFLLYCLFNTKTNAVVSKPRPEGLVSCRF